MALDRLRQPAVSALAVLLISGAGVAFAGSGPASSPVAAAHAAPAAQVTTLPAAEPTVEPTQPTEPTAEPTQPAGTDGDAIQQGDQTAPDAAGGSAETEKAGAETEKAGAEEAGDASLPGGGHADNPNDPNADHQFQGVE